MNKTDATEVLPEPLVPADCDLRGYDFMPLFGNRLFSSHLYRKAIRDPRAGLAAIKLWWAAWTQCPAGSLPDDDDDLAMLADFGLDTKAWQKVRLLALHGFIKCSDGRLYHPLLCEEALNAYDRRRRERERKAQHRAKKTGQSPDSPDAVPRDNPRTGEGTDQGTTYGTGRAEAQGQTAAVRSDRTGQDRTGQDSIAPDRDKPRDMPRLGEPPDRWLHLADRRVVDDRDGRTHATINGYYLDGAAQEVCQAARINEANWRGDWRPLIAWLQAGYELPDIIEAVKRVASRPNYRPPGSLAYFDQAVREGKVAA